MSNEIVKKEMPVLEMMEMAKMFKDSGMFKDLTSVALAFVKIQAGKEIGVAPFAAISGIHIIQGKATVGAGLMAGLVKGSGKYNYKVIQLTDEVCSIDFYKGSEKIGNSTFTKADATKACTQNMAKFPKNMLFARAMSNGTKWYCPDVFTMPVYTPEEMGDANFTEDISHEDLTVLEEEKKEAAKQFETDVQDATTKLQACINLPQLQVTFQSLPKKVMEAVITVKDEMKAKLTPTPSAVLATPVEGATLVTDAS